MIGLCDRALYDRLATRIRVHVRQPHDCSDCGGGCVDRSMTNDEVSVRLIYTAPTITRTAVAVGRQLERRIRIPLVHVGAVAARRRRRGRRRFESHARTQHASADARRNDCAARRRGTSRFDCSKFGTAIVDRQYAFFERTVNAHQSRERIDRRRTTVAQTRSFANLVTKSSVNAFQSSLDARSLALSLATTTYGELLAAQAHCV